MAVLSHPRNWAVWDIVFPPLCSVCGGLLKENDILFCSSCWAKAPIAEDHTVKKLRYADDLRAGFVFSGDNVIRAAVHALKYEAENRLADEMVRRWIPRIPAKFLEAPMVWVPVPQHWMRRILRGYNQASALTASLARALDHHHVSSLLRRVRNTPTQTGMSYRERIKNIRNAFRVVRLENLPNAFRVVRLENLPESVVLIDDVVTTGATVDECARILKSAGVEWVGALTFARAR